MKYSTLPKALEKLKKAGYTADFRFEDGKLENIETGAKYLPQDLRIAGYQRFEGDSNPSDTSIVFAVHCADEEKGVVISSYGTYATDGLLAFMDKVKISERSSSLVQNKEQRRAS